MSQRIRKVAVLGAGVIGSGIAAHVANAGIQALLLDIVPPQAKPGEDTSSRAFRDRFAANALVQLKKAKPDRKSTRLNSSHVKNSYAVFCLKKKIKQITVSCNIFLI